MSEWAQSFTLTQNVDWGYFLCTTLPACGVINQPHYIKMSSQGVVSGTKASDNPGLCPIKGDQSGLCRWTRAWNKFLSLSLSTTKQRHITKCWFSTQHLILFLIFYIETPKDSSGPTNFWREPPLPSLLVISFPCTLAFPGTQYIPTVCRVERSFNVSWHCHTNGDVVLAAWSAFRAAWLSEQSSVQLNTMFNHVHQRTHSTEMQYLLKNAF